MAVIDTQKLKNMFISGANALDAKKEWINELNVFPVPDGDTGTNMTMTIMSAVKAVSEAEESMDPVLKAISTGALRGARGNSGVILSQLLRGFVKGVQGNEVLTVPVIVNGCQRAVETAYKAVMAPKEGTILSVARAMNEKAQEFAEGDSISDLLEAVIGAGDEMLKRTPDLLPVLKQAGVVDSGGQGLMVIMHGLADVYFGREVDLSIPEFEGPNTENIIVDVSNLETSDIKYGYCTEFIINLEREFTEQDEYEFKHYLTSIGNSLVCVADEELVKIHVHTNNPGLAIEKALTYGSLSRMKIDNMREEHRERLFKDVMKLASEQKRQDEEKERQAKALVPEEKKDVGFISVCCGDGLTELFRELGADIVISGGQTMNPSTDDFLQGIRRMNADHVVILPNNGNVILSANQAAGLTKDKEVTVIPTKTICEGISCLVNYVPQDDLKAAVDIMTEGIGAVSTIEVTYAIRDTMIDDVQIRKDDYIALSGKSLLSAGKDLNAVVKEAVGKTLTEDSYLVTLYYGDSVEEEAAGLLASELSEISGDTEVESILGGQPVYYYIISVE